VTEKDRERQRERQSLSERERDRESQSRISNMKPSQPSEHVKWKMPWGGIQSDGGKQRRQSAKVMGGGKSTGKGRGGGRGGGGGGFKGPGTGMPGGGPSRGVGGAVGGFGRGGLGGPGGGKIRKDREQRYGKLVAGQGENTDKMDNGQYIPWARSAAPGSVKEVTFNTEGRTSYLTGFRKRKAERQTFAKKNISDKERSELRKDKRDKKSEMLEKYDARVAEMKKIADDAYRLEKRNEAGKPQVDHDDSDSDDEDEEEESEEEAMLMGPKKKVTAFGDQRSGTASTVEIREMDLSELHESAVLPPLLPLRATHCSH